MPAESLAVLSAVLLLLAAAPSALLWSVEKRYGPQWAVRVLLALVGALVVSLAIASQVLAAFGVTAFMLTAAYGYGAIISRLLDLDNSSLHPSCLPLRVAIGLAVFVIVGIALGLAGMLVAPVLAIAVLVGLVLASHALHRSCKSDEHQPNQPRPGAALVWWWIALLMLVGLIGAVAPEVRYDALTAHLLIAREFAVHHAIVEMRQNIASYFQLNVDLLYAMSMLFIPGEAVPKLLHYSAGVLAVFLTYDLGTRLWQPVVGLAAAAIVASTPLVWWVSGTAYTDLWAMLFVAAAMNGLVLLSSRPSPRRAAAVGLLAGAAAATKLTSLAVVLPIAAVVIALGGMLPSWQSRWRIFSAFVLSALLTGAFWYVRAWILTGNPVFPLLNAVFKSSYWPAENTRFNLDLFGMGTRPWDLLLVPWRMTWHPERFVEQGNIGFAYLLLLPFAVLAIVRGKISHWLWGTFMMSGVLWFFGAQYLRYLLPLLPVAAVIGAAGALGGIWPQGIVRIFYLLLVVAILSPSADWIRSGGPNFPWGVASGSVSRAEYTSMYVSGFSVANYVRRKLPPSARIYGAGEDEAFYYNRFFVPSSWYAYMFNPSLPDLVLRARSGREVETMLLRSGLNYLVVNRNAGQIVQWRNPEGWLARETLWEEGPWLEYAYRESYLFRLRPGGTRETRRHGTNLLQNGEMVLDSAPRGWNSHGKVSLVHEGNGVNGVATWVQVSVDAYLMQHVTVTPDRIYVLEAQVRSARSRGIARLSMQWLNDGNRVLDYTTSRDLAITSEPGRYAMACTAPEYAQAALVWLIGGEGGSEFREAKFYQLQ